MNATTHRPGDDSEPGHAIEHGRDTQQARDIQHAHAIPVAAALDTLLDPGSVQNVADTPGLSLALGTIHGRDVAVFILSEAPQSVAQLRQLSAFIAAAGLRRDGLIGIHADTLTIDSDGDAYDAQAGLLQALGQASLHAPYLAICAAAQGGVNALLCAQADAVLMLAHSGALYLSGPDSVLAVRGLFMDEQALGGSRVHDVDSGLATRTCLHLVDALLQARRYLGLLNGKSADACAIDSTPQHALTTLRPNDHTPYDMRELIANLIDHADWFERQANHGPAIITGLARLHGQTVGIVANDPRVNAGCLDATACRKAAAFVQLCSQRGYAMLSIIDTPGFLPGPEQEAAGIVSAAQALIQAWQQSASARITLLAGRGLGGAGMAMGLGIQAGAPSTAAQSDVRWSATGDSRASIEQTDPVFQGTNAQGAAIVTPSQTRQALARALLRINQPNGA